MKNPCGRDSFRNVLPANLECPTQPTPETHWPDSQTVSQPDKESRRVSIDDAIEWAQVKITLAFLLRHRKFSHN